jgi:hypothetical protein
MGWTVWGSSPVGREIFCTHLDQPWDPPNRLYDGYCVFFPGVKWLGPGVQYSPPSSTFLACYRVSFLLFEHCTSVYIRVNTCRKIKWTKWYWGLMLKCKDVHFFNLIKMLVRMTTTSVLNIFTVAGNKKFCCTRIQYCVLYMNWMYLINTLRFVALESYVMKAELYECYQDICAVSAVCVVDGTVMVY